MKKTLGWVGCILVVLGVMYCSFDYYTRGVLREACADWPLLNRSLAELPHVYPATSAGQSTKDLQALYKKISLGDSQDIDILQRLKDYMHKELESPVATIGVLPPEVQKTLLDNLEIIEQITNLLITEELLIFPLDLETNPVEEVPAPAPWIRPINTLLIVSALSAQLEGNMYQAWLFLEASARLNDALFLQPSFISQILAIAESRNILLAMRKMTVPAPDWAQGWPNHDFANRMLMAYTAEAHMMLNMVNKTSLSALHKSDSEARKMFEMDPTELGVATKLTYALAGQSLLRFFASEQIVDSRRFIEQRSREGECVSQPAKKDASDERLLSWYPGKEVLSALIRTEHLYKYWNHLYLLAVYKAGTQTILETKTSKTENTENRWPRVPTIPADVCLDHSWSYQHKPDGSVIFFYDKPLSEGTSSSSVKAGYLQYIGGRDE